MDEAESSRDVPDPEGETGPLGFDAAGRYEIPNPTRRRVSGYVFLGGALLAVLGVPAGLPGGLFIMAGVLAVLGLLHFLAGWRLTTSAEEALAVAGREVSFPVGHASAVVTFAGWRSRPVWQVMVYSADDPPTTRGLVRLDGVSGTVLGEAYEEEVD